MLHKIPPLCHHYHDISILITQKLGFNKMIFTTTSALALMMHLLRLRGMDLKVFVKQITFFSPPNKS